MNSDNIKASIRKLMKNKQFLAVSLCVVIFACASIYVYIRYVKPKSKYVDNKEFITKDQNDEVKSVDLYFFYTSWCPHCKTAFPIWNTLKNDNNTIKGVSINYIEVDCDKDSDTANKYNVEGYPTIKLQKGNTVIEYDAKPELDTILHFLNTSL